MKGLETMTHIPLKTLYDISVQAGKAIMDVYIEEIAVEVKEDASPLTLADQRSHHVIVEGLQQLDELLPILSEEGSSIPYSERKQWDAFWLVDPLDGTKEFIKKNDEFTVNIALIKNGFPTLGIIYAPALDTFYFGQQGVGSFKLEQASTVQFADDNELIEKSLPLQIVKPNKNETVRVVASRSHMSKETEAFIEEQKLQYAQVDVISAGSSLKFCLVAEGKAHYYPRYAPTMEWDTAAGQAIVEAAGGIVINYTHKGRIQYNKENLLNEWFLVTNEEEIL